MAEYSVFGGWKWSNIRYTAKSLFAASLIQTTAVYWSDLAPSGYYCFGHPRKGQFFKVWMMDGVISETMEEFSLRRLRPFLKLIFGTYYILLFPKLRKKTSQIYRRWSGIREICLTLELGLDLAFDERNIKGFLITFIWFIFSGDIMIQRHFFQ